ncbi:chemotaxis protein CheW [Gemmata sp.]|uniref:chemotaxis protein CheW n=1 Tax=Gemmata sp. TaxID=1914242 RepID=UPI003F7277D7
MPLDQRTAAPAAPDDSDLPDWLTGGAPDSGAPLLADLPELGVPDPPEVLAPPAGGLGAPAAPCGAAAGAPPAPAFSPPREAQRGWRFTRQDVSHLPTDGPDERSYRFHVSNTSRTRAFECAVEFPLPPGCGAFRASGTPKRTGAGLEWGLGTLAPGARVELSVWLPLSDETAPMRYAPAAVRIATRPAESPAGAHQPPPRLADVADRVPVEPEGAGGTPDTCERAAPAAAPAEDDAPGTGHRGTGSRAEQSAEAPGDGPAELAPDTPAAGAPAEFGAPPAALVVSVTAPPRVELEEEFACHVSVANRTASPAAGLRVRLPVPEELVFRGATLGGTLSTAGDHVEWPPADLERGAVWGAEARFAGFAPGHARLGVTTSAGGVPDGSAEARLDCVLRSGAGGTTLAAILEGLALPAPGADGPAVAAGARSGERHLVVRAAHASLALPLCHVRDVLRPLPLTPLPGVPEWVAGVANVRGEVVTVIDLAGFLDLGDDAPRRGLVVAQGGDGCVLGLLVGEVAGIRPVAADAGPPVENRLSRFVTGVGADAGGIVHRLAVVELLSAVEAELGDPATA